MQNIITKTLFGLVGIAIMGIGIPRSVGGYYYMQSWEARTALAKGQADMEIPTDALIADLQKSIRWWPLSAAPHDALGVFLLQRSAEEIGQTQTDTLSDALAAFNNATARAPGNTMFWVRTSMTHMALGEHTAARTALAHSFTAGRSYPLAAAPRLELGNALWPLLSSEEKAAVVHQGVLLCARSQYRKVATLLNAAPAELRNAVIQAVPTEQRTRLIGQVLRTR